MEWLDYPNATHIARNRLSDHVSKQAKLLRTDPSNNEFWKGGEATLEAMQSKCSAHWAKVLPQHISLIDSLKGEWRMSW